MKSKRSTAPFISAFAAFKNKKAMNDKVKKKKLNKISPLKNIDSKLLQEEVKKSAKKRRPSSTLSKQNGDADVSISEVSDVNEFSSIPCGTTEAQKCFEWLINSMLPKDFFSNIWEKKPLHVRRNGQQYYKGIFSSKEFDRILREHHLEYQKNIDVVMYNNGNKEVLDADGRAYAPVVWDYYQNGWSVRLLNPQTFSKSVWKVNSLLQEYFGSFVGANVYLTPPGSQGFAPHYDDIEAFILQLEGRKLWKVYEPRFPKEELPRYSSENFKEDEIGSPVLEIEVQPGDLLYFPRGYIHQAKTPDDCHSLHITVSTYQKNTWGDLLEQIIPQALQTAIASDIEYRESLPKDYMNYLGCVNTDNMSQKREQCIQKLIHLTSRLSHYLLVDTGADKLAKDFIHSSLPPSLTQEEKVCSIHGGGENCENGKIRNVIELEPDTEIRIIRKRAVRLVREGEQMRLYHSLENSRVYKERDALYVEIEWELTPAVEKLIHSYPKYITIEKLPLNSLQDKMEIATLLYDKGLIVTKFPMTDKSDDEK